MSSAKMAAIFPGGVGWGGWGWGGGGGVGGELNTDLSCHINSFQASWADCRYTSTHPASRRRMTEPSLPNSYSRNANDFVGRAWNMDVVSCNCNHNAVHTSLRTTKGKCYIAPRQRYAVWRVNTGLQNVVIATRPVFSRRHYTDTYKDLHMCHTVNSKDTPHIAPETTSAFPLWMFSEKIAVNHYRCTTPRFCMISTYLSNGRIRMYVNIANRTYELSQKTHVTLPCVQISFDWAL